MVGYMRRNFLVPAPSFESFDALNARLARMDDLGADALGAGAVV